MREKTASDLFPSKQLLQRFGIEGLDQQAVGGGDHFRRRVAAAAGVDTRFAAGAELRNQLRSVQAGHLRVHQDHFGLELCGGEHFQRRGPVLGGMNGIAAHGEQCGGHLAAHQVVVDEQDDG